MIPGRNAIAKAAGWAAALHTAGKDALQGSGQADATNSDDLPANDLFIEEVFAARHVVRRQRGLPACDNFQRRNSVL